MYHLVVTTMFILSSLFACQQPKNYTTLSTSEFESLIKEESVQRLDVRTPLEFSEGHIAKSININVLDGSFQAIADSLLQKDVPVALYCRSGHRSKKAASILAKQGFQVYELAEGFNGWQQAGKPVDK